MAQRVKTDWTLLATIGALVVFGLVMLFSASSVMSQEQYKSSWYLVSRQFLWALVAAAALLFFRTRDYLRLGPISMQPSELAKPALVVFLAYCLTMRSRSVNNWHTLAQATLALSLLAGAVAVTPHRMVRVFGFFDPEYRMLGIGGAKTLDPMGKLHEYLGRSAYARDPSYQVRQSKIAVGSGGVTGRGLVVQAMVNMSVVLDLVPTKGLPLPMISQGGSSLLSTLTSLGLLLSVSEHAG